MNIKKEMKTIPNILTMIRLCSVPVFAFFVIFGGFTQVFKYFIYIGFAIFLAAACTDLFDGAIARKYNQVTDLGKVLDPMADKAMHMGVILSLTIIGYINWIFIVLLAIKEVTMIICGTLLVKGGVIVHSNMLGKIASFVLSAGVILAFFHPFFAKYVFYLDWIIIGVALLLTYAAFFNYSLTALKDFKRIKLEKQYKQAEEKGEKNE